MASQLYALVLAGGSGERFWPLSRKSRPKQLLRLLSETTLLEETLQRLEGLVPPEHTLLLTNRDQEETVRALLPDFPQENILAEPAKRDTAAAIALGAARVCVRDPFATMAVLPADHRINDREAFQGDIRSAAEAAGATGEDFYSEAVDKIRDYLIRIQVRSPEHPELDGSWFRAFDYARWDYWASNADSGWGPWGTQTGWTQSWILNSMMLHQAGENYWDRTALAYKNNPGFKKLVTRKIKQMLD